MARTRNQLIRISVLLAAIAGPSVFPTLSGAAEAEDATSLPAELGWVKFRITAGRLQVVIPSFRDSKTFESGNPLVGTSETFRLNASSESATVHYHATSPEEMLTVNFDGPVAAVIERTPTDEGSRPALKYEQTPDGRVSFIVGDDKQAREHTASSFWQLSLLAADDVETHLLPILTSLRPGWAISETTSEIEDALVKLAQSGQRPDRRRWAKLFEQLGSSSFQQRRSAERKLRESGPAALAYLTTVSAEPLDAERRARVDRLLEALSSTTDDTPDRIAVWLVDDALAWTTVLNSEKLEHREVALEQLERLFGRQIDFDIDANEQVRAAQVEALQAKLRGS